MFYKRIPVLLTSALCAVSLQLQAETLKDIYSLSLDNDPLLRAQTAAYRAGKEYLAIGRSNLLPQITARATYSDTQQDHVQSFVTGQPATEFDSDSQNSTYTATLTQPLFNMAAWYGYQQGKSLSNLAEARFSADQQNLIVRVSERYFDVLRAIDNLKTAQSEEKALGHQLEQTRQRFEVGLTAITDVHEAQSAFDNATANTVGAQGQLGISFELLEVLTGESHKAIAPLVDEFPVVNPVPSNRADWVESALANNYNLKMAKINAKSANANAKSKASNHLPTVAASVMYADMNDTNTSIHGDFPSFDNDSRVYDGTTFAVQLDIPIFSGLRVSSERRQAYEFYNEAQETYNKTQRDTVQAARALHLSVVTGVAQVKARKQAITSSQSALEATQAGYEVGTRNLVDVLVAQRNLFNAQRTYDNARYDYLIFLLKLKEVAGNLSPEDILKLDRWLDTKNQVKKDDYT